MTPAPPPPPPPPPPEIEETIAALDPLITFLRRRGVITYKDNGLTLTILPNEPVVVDPPFEPEPEPAVKEVDKSAAPEKLGKDGLSQEMQAELYGRSMPDWE
jgi:hypothetical protein